MEETLKIRVNGLEREVRAEPGTPLLYVLRNDLKLKGARFGCGQGHCGACTVLLDGKTVTSCMVLALDARDKDLTTVEGLAQGERLHPVQVAFVQYGGVQCGFCTPV